MKIGLCWGGSRDYHRDFARSTDLAQWWPLIRTPGTEWVALLTGDRRDEATGHPSWFTLPDLPDWGTTAALLQDLDLVITVDTALAHVAGDAGVPTWVLIPTPCDWRWLDAGTTTAWYPSVRLFRQQHAGDWWAVFDGLKAALDKELAPCSP